MICLTAAMTLGPRLVFSFTSAAVVPGRPVQHSPPSFWSPLSRFLLRKPTFFSHFVHCVLESSQSPAPEVVLGWYWASQRHRDWFGLTCDASEAGRISLQTFSGITGGECPHLAFTSHLQRSFADPTEYKAPAAGGKLNTQCRLCVYKWSPCREAAESGEGEISGILYPAVSKWRHVLFSDLNHVQSGFCQFEVKEYKLIQAPTL